MKVIEQLDNGWRYVETEPTDCHVRVESFGFGRLYRWLLRRPLYWYEDRVMTQKAWVKGDVDFHLDMAGKTIIHTFSDATHAGLVVAL